MKVLQKWSRFLSDYTSLVVIVIAAITFFIPNLMGWVNHQLFIDPVSNKFTSQSIIIGIIMFSMGLTLTTDDFQILAKRPFDIAIGAIAQYLIMPFLALTLTKLLQLPDGIALGLILVGCCPGETASNVMTFIARGDVSLSVGMTICSTLLAPIVTPLLVYGLAGTWVDVSVSAMIVSVVKVILIPVLLGLLIHRLLGDKMTKISPFVPLISVVAIVFIIAGIIANNIAKIVSCGLLVLCVVMIHNLVGILFGLLASKLFNIDYDKATAIAIEVGMQNSGLAVTLATAHFAMHPLATLPGAIFSVWHNISGSIFASIRNRKYEGTSLNQSFHELNNEA